MRQTNPVPVTTNEKILANKKAREDAEGLVKDLANQPPRFWEVLHNMAAERMKTSIVTQAPPMSEEEAIQFERTEIPFGKYEGYEIGEIKTEYLVWMCEGDEFTKKVRRYVNSKTFQQRQREESNGQP